ncbi:MAG: hypothetical protein ACI8XO_004768, partial [Verrucomicrobiales bacterium]
RSEGARKPIRSGSALLATPASGAAQPAKPKQIAAKSAGKGRDRTKVEIEALTPAIREGNFKISKL